MKYTESSIQQSIVKAVRLIYPKSLIFSVPNEGKRSYMLGSVLKANGLIHGVSDLVLLHKGQCIFLEVKKPNAKQTPHQKTFERLVTEQGFIYKVVYSVEDVLNLITNLK